MNNSYEKYFQQVHDLDLVDVRNERDKYKAMCEWFASVVQKQTFCPPIDNELLPDCDNKNCAITCEECWIEAAKKTVQKEGE